VTTGTEREVTEQVRDWVLARLEAVKDRPRVLLRDPLRLLAEKDVALDTFARENGFSAISTHSNLVFRDLYERLATDPETEKILLIDRTPLRRRTQLSVTQSPPPFYPDFLAETPPEARIDLDLRQFLVETTGDPNWPREVDDSRYARLINRHLAGVLHAHENLRTAHQTRFTDNDFQRIVACAALGISGSAFKTLDAEDYWRIGLLGHDALEELEDLAPEVTKPIREELLQAPVPFCWFADRDPDLVVRALYLSTVFFQHLPNVSLLLANIDPALAPFAGVRADILEHAVPRLVELDPEQAGQDLSAAEASLDRDALRLVLLEQMRLAEPAGWAAALERERYSTLVRCLALLLALDDLLSGRPARPEQDRIAAAVFPTGARGAAFADSRPSTTWTGLREAYELASGILPLVQELSAAVRSAQVAKTGQLTFGFFWDAWNGKRINRLEHSLSALGRLIESAELLPRPENELPSLFGEALDRIKERAGVLAGEVYRQLDALNRRFQDLVAEQYPSWVAEDGEVRLTAQFLRRCLKPHWDPQAEKAVVFIFDGMRYDIWDELLRPMLADRMTVLEDYPAASILPSETQLTRKAISAGVFPEAFDYRAGEDRLLREGLERELGLTCSVVPLAPEGAGTGETVRYRAGNLDVYIFELCDKELHRIGWKTLPDGREVPSRPLSFIYGQVRDLLETEVMAIVRRLEPGTKVFITADHGFGRVGRESLWFPEDALNEASDCSYLNCWLRSYDDLAYLPTRVQENLIAFRPQELRVFDRETIAPRNRPSFEKEYGAVVFPKVGHAFSRSGSPFNPDAYSHGGISIQELLIPMVVLRVEARDEGPLVLEPIEGPAEIPEGAEAVFRLRLHRAGDGADELRVEVEARYSREPDRFPLQGQVLYVPPEGTPVVYRFVPDPGDATPDERLQGAMERTLTVTASCREGRRTVRKTRSHRFTVRLQPDRIVRRMGNLGNILGLTPKSIRG
jgi:PglZ domain-containing protein